MNFKKIIIAIVITFTTLTVSAIERNNQNPEAFKVFVNMDVQESMGFMEDMGITTETFGKEIFFNYNGSPAFILKKNTEYTIIPDPNGGFTIESKKSYVMGNLNYENVLEFSHLNKNKMKIKRYRKE